MTPDETFLQNIIEHPPKKSEKAGRLGRAGFNCFYCPGVSDAVLHAAEVEGKGQHRDVDFALNGLPRGGRLNQQADPLFKAPIPERFPFKDEDILAGKVTVAQMPKFYRDARTPAAGNPEHVNAIQADSEIGATPLYSGQP